MASIEELIIELKKLTPEQVDEVAQVIHGLSRSQRSRSSPPRVIPAEIVDQAVQHGWTAQLFTEVIGSLPDLERQPQPPLQKRPDL